MRHINSTAVKLILFFGLSFLALRGCVTYSKVTHLSDEDLMWVNHNFTETPNFVSDSGITVTMTLLQKGIWNETNPVGDPFSLFEVSSDYEAQASVVYELCSSRDTIKWWFFICRDAVFDTLTTEYSFGQLHRIGRNEILQTSQVNLKGRVFDDCFIADLVNSNLSEEYRNMQHKHYIEKFIVSRKHGLIYYKYADGEEYFRQFDE